jgi:hypothetical protein
MSLGYAIFKQENGWAAVRLAKQAATRGPRVACKRAQDRYALFDSAKGQSLDELFLGEPSKHHDRSHREQRCGG